MLAKGTIVLVEEVVCCRCLTELRAGQAYVELLRFDDDDAGQAPVCLACARELFGELCGLLGFAVPVPQHLVDAALYTARGSPEATQRVPGRLGGSGDDHMDNLRTKDHVESNTGDGAGSVRREVAEGPQRGIFAPPTPQGVEERKSIEDERDRHAAEKRSLQRARERHRRQQEAIDKARIRKIAEARVEDPEEDGDGWTQESLGAIDD